MFSLSLFLLCGWLANASALRTIARLGCDGGVDFFTDIAGGPLSMRFNGFNKFFGFIEDFQEQSVSDPDCGCDKLDTEDVRKYFRTWSPEFLFNMADGFAGDRLSVPECGIEEVGPSSSATSVELPSTCSAERWAEGKGCQLAVTRTVGDMALVLRVERCAERDLPFFELKCEGADCDLLGSACSKTSDCGSENLVCAPVVNTATQCRKETCGPYGQMVYESAELASCKKANAYQAKPPASGCKLDGATYGAGFAYMLDKKDAKASKVPQSAADVGECVRMECGDDGEWAESTSDPRQCLEALTVRGEPAAGQCSDAAPREANPLWPLSSENTCNYRELLDDAQHGTFGGVKVEPFAIGSTRFASNTPDSPAAVMSYDAVDYLKDATGGTCMDGEDAYAALKQFMFEQTLRKVGKSAKSMATSDELGFCLPTIADFELVEQVPPEPVAVPDANDKECDGSVYSRLGDCQDAHFECATAYGDDDACERCQSSLECYVNALGDSQGKLCNEAFDIVVRTFRGVTSVCPAFKSFYEAEFKGDVGFGGNDFESFGDDSGEATGFRTYELKADFGVEGGDELLDKLNDELGLDCDVTCVENPSRPVTAAPTAPPEILTAGSPFASSLECDDPTSAAGQAEADRRDQCLAARESCTDSTCNCFVAYADCLAEDGLQNIQCPELFGLSVQAGNDAFEAGCLLQFADWVYVTDANGNEIFQRFANDVSQAEIERARLLYPSDNDGGDDEYPDLCKATCKETVAYKKGTAYTDKDKFDGSSKRKVRTVEPITQDAVVLFHAGCDGSGVFLPNHETLGMEISLAGMMEFALFFRQEHRANWDCRAEKVRGGEPLEDGQYNVRATTLDNPLYFGTLPLSKELTALGEMFSDLRVTNVDNENRLNMPSTCTFDEWYANGVCKMQFTGLGQPEMFDDELNLNVMLSVCPGSFVPELYVECAGDGCQALNGPNMCAKDSDCPASGMVCQQIESLAEEFGAGGDGDEEEDDSGRDETTFASSERPETVDKFTGYVYISLEESSKSTPPIKLASSGASVAGKHLTVSFDGFAGGVTEGKTYKVIDGKVSGEFDAADWSSPHGVESTCDYSDAELVVQYKADGVYVGATCDCSFARRRRRAAAAPRSVGRSMLAAASGALRSAAGSLAELVPADVRRTLRAATRHARRLAKRQSGEKGGDFGDDGAVERQSDEYAEEAESGTSTLGILLGGPGTLGWYNEESCERSFEQVAENFLPRLLSTLAGVSFDAKKAGVCWLDAEAKNADGKLLIDVWADKQAEVDGTELTLAYLKAWQVDARPRDGGQSLVDRAADNEWFKQFLEKYGIDDARYAQDGKFGGKDGVFEADARDPDDDGSVATDSASQVALVGATLVFAAIVRLF